MPSKNALASARSQCVAASAAANGRERSRCTARCAMARPRLLLRENTRAMACSSSAASTCGVTGSSASVSPVVADAGAAAAADALGSPARRGPPRAAASASPAPPRALRSAIPVPAAPGAGGRRPRAAAMAASCTQVTTKSGLCLPRFVDASTLYRRTATTTQSCGKPPRAEGKRAHSTHAAPQTHLIGVHKRGMRRVHPAAEQQWMALCADQRAHTAAQPVAGPPAACARNRLQHSRLAEPEARRRVSGTARAAGRVWRAAHLE